MIQLMWLHLDTSILRQLIFAFLDRALKGIISCSIFNQYLIPAGSAPVSAVSGRVICLPPIVGSVMIYYNDLYIVYYNLKQFYLV